MCDLKFEVVATCETIFYHLNLTHTVIAKIYTSTVVRLGRLSVDEHISSHTCLQYTRFWFAVLFCMINQENVKYVEKATINPGSSGIRIKKLGRAGAYNLLAVRTDDWKRSRTNSINWWTRLSTTYWSRWQYFRFGLILTFHSKSGEPLCPHNRPTARWARKSNNFSRNSRNTKRPFITMRNPINRARGGFIVLLFQYERFRLTGKKAPRGKGQCRESMSK